MAQALALAEKGRGYVSPNPLVGALLVKNGKIVGKGYHKAFGGPHAEINALMSAKKRNGAKHATLYVTLEPCTFYGKTPPCVNALVCAGLKKVVIATQDPNPKVCGKGVAILKKAKIKTKVGVLAKACQKQNESYFKYIKRRLPFVILKIAASLDGKIALWSGKSKWISSKQSRDFGQKLRLWADAILVGVNTILQDNPRLTCRVAPNKELLKIILDSHLRIPLDALVFRKGKVIIFTAENNSLKAKQLTQKGVKIIKLEKNKQGLLPWQRILKELYQMGIATLLIEGGATVASEALKAKIVDKIYLFLAPKLLGKGISFTDTLAKTIKLKEYELHQMGNDILIEGYL